MASAFAQLQASDYAQAVRKLFPRGKAWAAGIGSLFDNFLNAIGASVYILHAAAINLVDSEINPFSTASLMPLWENDFGLPDPCVGTGQTLDQRRQALLARITDPGGLNAGRYIALAASIGVDITVSTFTPAQMGSGCGTPMYGASWKFAWQVNAPAEPITSVFRCDSACDDYLQTWGNAELECVINSRNRPSRVVLFAYGDD